MRTRVTAAVVILALVLLAACVPEPANRNPTNGVAAATPTVRPTPAGPTPTPSFVRPTPTPQPTFYVYTVRRGDTLARIARLNGTDGRSIAYWNRIAYPSLDPDSDSYKPDYVAVGWKLQLIPNTVVDPEELPPGPPTPSPEPDVPEESVIPIEG
jgi:hypothetical protein